MLDIFNIFHFFSLGEFQSPIFFWFGSIATDFEKHTWCSFEHYNQWGNLRKTLTLYGKAVSIQ